VRRSIATVCLSGTLEEKLEAAASAGFDEVELFEPDLIASALAPEEVRDRAGGLGLSEVVRRTKERLGLRRRLRCDRLGVHQPDLFEQRRGERLLGDEAVRDEHLAEAAARALVLLERQLELTTAQKTPFDEQFAEGEPGGGLGGHHLTNRRFS